MCWWGRVHAPAPRGTSLARVSALHAACSPTPSPTLAHKSQDQEPGQQARREARRPAPGMRRRARHFSSGALPLVKGPERGARRAFCRQGHGVEGRGGCELPAPCRGKGAGSGGGGARRGRGKAGEAASKCERQKAQNNFSLSLFGPDPLCVTNSLSRLIHTHAQEDTSPRPQSLSTPRAPRGTHPKKKVQALKTVTALQTPLPVGPVCPQATLRLALSSLSL